MNGLHHALYVAAAIAFAGAARRRSSPCAATPGRAARSSGAGSGRGGMSEASPDAAACGRAPRGDRRGGARRLRLGSYAGSTTAEIARAAGVSEPIIYRHFPSKRELWFACLDAAWAELRVGDRGRRSAARSRSGSPSRASAAEARSPWASPLLPNLWMQGVTEAGEDEEIQRARARATCARCTTSSPT